MSHFSEVCLVFEPESSRPSPLLGKQEFCRLQRGTACAALVCFDTLCTVNISLQGRAHLCPGQAASIRPMRFKHLSHGTGKTNRGPLCPGRLSPAHLEKHQTCQRVCCESPPVCIPVTPSHNYPLDITQ